MRPTGLNLHALPRDKSKDSELRVPTKLIVDTFSKHSKHLELIIKLKLTGSRVNAKTFFEGTANTTAKRYISQLQKLGWIGFDGSFIFPRSWSRIGYRKKKGLYIVDPPKNLNDFLFAYSLMQITKRETRARVRQGGRAMPKGEGLPVRYYLSSLGLSARTFFRKLKSAQAGGLIEIRKQNNVIGLAKDYPAFKKNLHDLPVFKKGKFTVVPSPSIYQFNLTHENKKDIHFHTSTI